MSLRHVYERTFDEDVPSIERSSNGCPECGGLVHTNSIETVCEDCGLVLEDRPVDRGPEWRTFDETEGNERKRTGPPLTPTRHDHGLSSEIGFDQADANGSTLSGRKRSQVARLRREHQRGRWSSKAEQNLARGLSEVRRIVGALDLPRSLRDQACQLYRTAAHEDLIRGRSIEAMAAASVSAACRCAGLPRTFTEVETMAAVSDERVRNAYGVLNRELELPTVPMEPPEYVPKLTSALDVSSATRQRAVDLAKQLASSGVASGCHPVGVAAGCIYQASLEHGERLTQESIADIAEVTPVTLRARWKQLQSVLNESINPHHRGDA
jgi:transcription initiation factor TFIIB